MQHPVSDPASLQKSNRAPVSAKLRWTVAGLLFLAAVLNYVDRNVFSLLAPTIQDHLHISDSAYAGILNAFLVAYLIAYVLSGRVTDRLGSRMSFTLFVGWWSLANALSALAKGPFSMGAFRTLLGFGEAGGWTVSTKVAQELFPPRERGMVIGIFSMGGSIGGMIAPLLVIPISIYYSWHWAFVITGTMGLAWVALWLWINRWIPQASPAERKAAAAAEREKRGGSEWGLWKSVLRQKAVWVFMISRLLTDSVWYFYLFWMPKYLNTERHMTQEELKIMWVIFLAADIGFVAGGYFSGRLIRRGLAIPIARLALMASALLIAPLSLGVAFVSSTALAIAFASLVAMGHASWLSNISALIADTIPKGIMATTFGIIAGGSALGGILMNAAVSRIVEHFSYKPCFVIMALMHPIAFYLLYRFRKPMVAAAAELAEPEPVQA